LRIGECTAEKAWLLVAFRFLFVKNKGLGRFLIDLAQSGLVA